MVASRPNNKTKVVTKREQLQLRSRKKAEGKGAGKGGKETGKGAQAKTKPRKGRKAASDPPAVDPTQEGEQLEENMDEPKEEAKPSSAKQNRKKKVPKSPAKGKKSKSKKLDQDPEAPKRSNSVKKAQDGIEQKEQKEQPAMSPTATSTDGAARAKTNVHTSENKPLKRNATAAALPSGPRGPSPAHKVSKQPEKSKKPRRKDGDGKMEFQPLPIPDLVGRLTTTLMSQWKSGKDKLGPEDFPKSSFTRTTVGAYWNRPRPSVGLKLRGTPTWRTNKEYANFSFDRAFTINIALAMECALEVVHPLVFRKLLSFKTGKAHKHRRLYTFKI